MKANNSNSSLESTLQQSNNSSRLSIPTLKRRFSANKMLSKAKESTKSLVHEVLEKRHSLDSKRSMNSNEENQSIPNTTSPISNRDSFLSNSSISLNNDKQPPTESDHHGLKSIKKRLSKRHKHHEKKNSTLSNTLKSNNSQESISSMTDASTSSASSLNADIQSQNNTDAAVAAAAEADILSGIERPGSFALACDFHLAKEKQNEEFHALFKSVPDNDMLIEYYKCALQKDILLQGHLYVSEHHVCFKSNIFGWVTNLVINFSEIVRVEKRMTAKIIPNGITIATNTSTHIFASFLLRDQAYDQIIKIWDLSKRANSARQSGSTDDESLDETDEDDDYEEGSIPSTDSAIALNSPPVLITDHHDPIIQQEQLPDNTTLIPANNTELANTNNTLLVPILNKTKQRPRSISDSPYPKANFLSFEPTVRTDAVKQTENSGTSSPATTLLKKPRVCPCVLKGEQHRHIALNETYDGTVDAMTKLLFHSSFCKSFLEKYENFEDVQLGIWKHGRREVSGKRKIKSSTSGTRMINILFQEKREHRKIPYYSCISTKKSMPDMPMGAVYSIQTRTCITRVNKEKVHVIISFEVVFSKSGLVSSIIEKNAADDQFRLYSHLNSILKKPELIRSLVDDKELLQHLKAINPTQDNPLANSKSWKGYLLNRMTSLSLTDCIYIGFFFVLVTHCILAIRLQRITHHLEWVQEQAHPIKHDRQWVSEKISLAHEHLNQLKSEVKGYDERISKLRDQQKLKM